jgi:hypothetical protein
MTPARARLTLFAMMALFAITAGNALFMQERPHALRPKDLPSTEVLIPQFPPDTPPAEVSRPLNAPAEGQDRVQMALQRELAARGYSAGKSLRLAVIAYEFDSGLPLTGDPNKVLLTHVLFDLNQAPKGVFADRAEANPRLVRLVQNTLLGLGFFSGTLSGRMDVWTINAVKEFQRHRNLELTGRLSELTLLDLVTYTGQPLHLDEGASRRQQ